LFFVDKFSVEWVTEIGRWKKNLFIS